MSILTRNILLYGKEEDLPKEVFLRAGPLTLTYQAGELRYIHYNGQEVVRRIYAAIRDHNWGTAPNVISNEKIHIRDDTFRIGFDVNNRLDEIDYTWRGTIKGNADGKIRYTFDGQALKSFLTCRIGFCVLHPIEICAGKRCLIEKESGEVVTDVFPHFISAGEMPSFQNMIGMAWGVSEGVQAELRFTGDLFEMEDQRNWTDGSYKTYCTPSRLPCPVEVKKGDKVQQSVALTIVVTKKVPNRKKFEKIDEKIEISIGNKLLGKIPPIGLCMASHGKSLTLQEVTRLKALNLAHLRLYLTPGKVGEVARLQQATIEANKLGVPLEIALYLNNPEQELKDLADLLKQVTPNVCRWLIFQEGKVVTPDHLVQLARHHLSNYDRSAKFGGGSDADFYELNSNRSCVDGLDFACYSINPQIHAYDNGTLVENLETQAMTIDSTRQFVGNMPIVVGPVTLKQRFNPAATGPIREVTPGELPPQVDVRQMSLFGAGWTLGSLKYILEAKAYSITYYETTGWRGVVELEMGSEIPNKFQSTAGSVFPLYHVFADVGEFAAGEIISTSTSAYLSVLGLGLRKNKRMRLLVVNLTPSEQLVHINGLDNQAKVRLMDETNVEMAMRSPEEYRNQSSENLKARDGEFQITLKPYAIGCFDTNIN